MTVHHTLRMFVLAPVFLASATVMAATPSAPATPAMQAESIPTVIIVAKRLSAAEKARMLQDEARSRQAGKLPLASRPAGKLG